MENKALVPLMVSVPTEVRDELRRIAARQNLENPERVVSGAEIAREVICKHYLEYSGKSSPDGESNG